MLEPQPLNKRQTIEFSRISLTLEMLTGQTRTEFAFFFLFMVIGKLSFVNVRHSFQLGCRPIKIKLYTLSFVTLATHKRKQSTSAGDLSCKS
jgi:hypothetical protein